MIKSDYNNNMTLNVIYYINLILNLFGCVISIYFATKFIPFEKDNCYGYGQEICTYGRIYSVLVIIVGGLILIGLIIFVFGLVCLDDKKGKENNNTIVIATQV
jgi:Na+/phosphate symporter